MDTGSTPEPSRRALLRGAGFILCAPAIVRASSLMAIAPVQILPPVSVSNWEIEPQPPRGVFKAKINVVWGSALDRDQCVRQQTRRGWRYVDKAGTLSGTFEANIVADP